MYILLATSLVNIFEIYSVTSICSARKGEGEALLSGTEMWETKYLSLPQNNFLPPGKGKKCFSL